MPAGYLVPVSYTHLDVYKRQQYTMSIGTSIITASSLSFLGMGAQPLTPEWGLLLSNGRNYMLTSWHITLFPGLAIFFTVLCFNLLGDGLRDALDPKLTD